VIYTIQTQMNTKGLRWSAPVQVNVAEISAPDRDTVVFKLKKSQFPLPRIIHRALECNVDDAEACVREAARCPGANVATLGRCRLRKSSSPWTQSEPWHPSIPKGRNSSLSRRSL
jgi:hypothetical protein